ncbi:MAG TPA: hypothetical protein VN426_07435 [Syntrophomonadaceae bacterium]|nr:hypothetical protein [Syntrophomonadaceae bacterium]
MKIKKWPVLVSMALGGVMLFGAAFASASGSTGYDVYKSALKNTATATSMTTQVQVAISDNGSTVMNVDGTAKMDQGSKAMSSLFTITGGDKSLTMEAYHQDGKIISKSSASDVYYVMERNSGLKPQQEMDKATVKGKYAQDVENLIDTVVGDIKNYTVVNANADGSQEVSLQLSSNQIPATANAFASLAIKSASQEGWGHGRSTVDGDLFTALPKLVDGISITNVDIKAVVDAQDMIQSQEVNITITGQDASGANHNVVVNAKLNLSNINQTTPDTIDLTGKQVNTLQPRNRGVAGH